MLNILSRFRLNRSSAPYLIHSPPGTGKSTTLKEIIRQMLAIGPEIKILVTAPSNAATDLLAISLLKAGQSEIFRYVSPSRDPSSVPDVLRPFSNIFPDPANLEEGELNESEEIREPLNETIMRARVVLATLTLAAKLALSQF